MVIVSYSYSTAYEFGDQFVTINGGEGNDTIRAAFINLLSSYSNTYTYTNSNGVTYTSTISGFFRSNNTYVTVTNWSGSNGAHGGETITSTLIYDRLIEYADGDGDDVVEDYHTGDSIKVDGSYTCLVEGSDVVIKVGTGSITLKNAKSQTIVINDAVVTLSSDQVAANVILTDKDKSPYSAADTVGGIDASQRTKKIQITGNANNNSIIGGKGVDTLNGGDGADTLKGGVGNDILSGGSGDDVFLVADGEGNDVINDYTTGDKVKLTSGKVSNIKVKNNDVILTIGKSKLTLKNAKSQSIEVENSNGTTSTIINGINLTYSPRLKPADSAIIDIRLKNKVLRCLLQWSMPQPYILRRRRLLPLLIFKRILAKEFTKCNKNLAPYIPIAKARGFSAHFGNYQQGQGKYRNQRHGG